MSSPIAIPANNSNFNSHSAHSPSMAARSRPGNANGLYVPVHRRGASTSSTSSSTTGSSLEPVSLSPMVQPTNGRMRSVSPMRRSPRAFGKRHHLDVSPAPSPRAAHIPLASMIPNTYTIPELLALSSASSPAHLSPPQRAQIDAHIPLMTRKPRSSTKSPSPAPSSSASSSPTSTTAPLPESTPARARAPKSNSPADAQNTRRRRPGRKNSGGKPRVAPTLATDVEERRRRNGAAWGWAAAAHGARAPEQDSWRSHAAVAVVAA